ncbi:DNA-3-methyladenine glycosylase I [Levilactobacillus suantsaii]|uniref:DNA-3-methyladenine glycosylase I n=1 Tax=Levilactobacillus suantsaii TaxID=2292255 RepID=A0A4Q0VFU0_9LACO|nr:DNA-3-methyladenine glycosylase I [Levilactobacillus suantsaii]QMU08240.1 DNA-3-methyladenine glycosylase I [Levilactobacillus suantsaii]RXI76048.1 DNA-3-methyladenine glycosylase I [Levilactobacillus suantsaii]
MTLAADDGQQWTTNGVQEYHAYFGTPTHDDHILFELMTVGVFQVGLSWQAADSKLPVFRRVFAGMALSAVAGFDLEHDGERIARDPQMIQNGRKIRATIQNARAILQIQRKFGSFADYLWAFVNGTPLLLPVATRDEIVNQSTIGSAVAKDLKRRECKFVGPVVTHMFLKAAGILQDQVLAEN